MKTKDLFIYNYKVNPGSERTFISYTINPGSWNPSTYYSDSHSGSLWKGCRHPSSCNVETLRMERFSLTSQLMAVPSVINIDTNRLSPLSQIYTGLKHA